MIRTVKTLPVIAALAVSACSPDASLSPDDLPEDLFQSGPEANEATPPYGINLYPDTKVISAMLDGITMLVEVNATSDELEAFYRSEFERLGYDVVERSENGDQVSLRSNGTGRRQGDLTIAINRMEGAPNRYILVFGKMFDSHTSQ
ncbi:hypothetical protein [Erythrobacter sp. F6033]|uniref:hypothetical protein n=1 Tax=Erythrobacter sp. F6033 TaxID=2926401 RepID=UPI001FF615EF|nr:hypothetical protein [Erythrobacter sp. F6033]MCK0128618.1 hypothetical protein [Erythrobacter sp. F6033]